MSFRLFNGRALNDLNDEGSSSSTSDEKIASLTSTLTGINDRIRQLRQAPPSVWRTQTLKQQYARQALTLLQLQQQRCALRAQKKPHR